MEHIYSKEDKIAIKKASLPLSSEDAKYIELMKKSSNFVFFGYVKSTYFLLKKPIQKMLDLEFNSDSPTQAQIDDAEEELYKEIRKYLKNHPRRKIRSSK